MTGQQILNLMNYFGKGIPNYAGDTMSDAQALLQINRAIRLMSKDLKQWDSLIAVTLVVGTRSHSIRSTNVFARKIVKPFYLVINGNPLWDASGKRFGFFTIHEADRYYPDWRTRTEDTTFAAILSGNEKITYLPPPNAAVVSAGNNYIAGTYMAADLTALSETPDIPEEFHECLAAMAATFASGALGEGEIWNRIKAINMDWHELVQDHAAINENAFADWGSTGGYAESDYLWV